MKKLIKAILLVLIFIGANVETFAAPPLSTIKHVKEMVENVRYQLPADMGYGMMLTQINYDSKTYTLVYRYHYTIPVTKPTLNSIKEAKLGLIHMLKTNPNSEEMQVLRDGISFHYNYYSQDGKFLYAIKITSADIK